MGSTSRAPRSSDSTLPRAGMMAVVRNRRGIIADVDEVSATDEGSLHLVTVDYVDSDGPPEEQLLWEREPRAKTIPLNQPPDVQTSPPMTDREFDALVDATRWSAVSPFLKPDDSGPLEQSPVVSPWYGAIQSEDFQLVPLLKAMEMPRVSLMLADDVGLGKTVEAGMIMRELLIRRRIRRILILTPASLQQQWQEEMSDKFSLSFDVVDRKSTQDLKKRMGLDANPWRTFPRIISSYHYLRQPNILEEFFAPIREKKKRTDTPAKLPWDLLIVDEAHNLMPSNYGEDSQLAQMLRQISPEFEHKLFLTATPHNGYTRSFTGLLESLDPTRFEQKRDLDDRDKERIDQFVVRRLKSDINRLDEARDQTRRFAKRRLHALDVAFDAPERALLDAFDDFRSAVKETVRHDASARTAANFAVEILNKRLLSSPFTFADSWMRFTEGLERDEAADTREVDAARRAAERDFDDDREQESADRRAARTTGAWLKSIESDVSAEIDQIDDALAGLGIDRRDVELSADGESVEEMPLPEADARYEALRDLVEDKLRTDDGEWVDDERLIVFTEYKTTLDYLVERLWDDFDDPEGRRILHLFGGMSQQEREDVKGAFNDPEHPVRLLVGTDAAGEGLNLQETARMVLHFDIPWNPARLDQRNGRLDRHGQARDVHIYHFDSDDNADLEFMSYVVDKVEEIREDLGSMGELFDSAFEKRFLEQYDTDEVRRSLEIETEQRRGATEDAHTGLDEQRLGEADRIEHVGEHLNLVPDRLANALEVAMAADGGYPQLEGPDEEGRYRFHQGTVPQMWRDVVEDALLVNPDEAKGRKKVKGALPQLAFDPDELVEQKNGRPVFRHPNDTALMHLGHPLFKQVLARFARLRFPTPGDDNASRWIARVGEVPEDADALIRLTVEELAVNELREPFHHWVRTLEYPLHGTELGEPLDYRPPTEWEEAEADPDATDRVRRDIWPPLAPQLRRVLDERSEALTDRIESHLDQMREDQLEATHEHFETRIREVNELLQKHNVPAIRQQLEAKKREKQQTTFLIDQERRINQEIRQLEEDLAQAETRHYENLVDRLEDERDRMVEHVVPNRYRLSGDVQVFPVAIEIVLDE